MSELDRLDARLAAAVRGFADGARTDVDAVAVAARAARARRSGALGWLEETVPVPVALLLLIGLLLLLTVSLAVGGWWPYRWSLVPIGPTTPTAAATSVPLPTGEALVRAHVTGTESLVLTTAPTSIPETDTTHMVGGVVTITTVASDPRASGVGTFAFSVDANGDVGREWGTYRLATAGGAWEGPCTGATWDSGNAALGQCVLVGSGAFAGYTYLRGYSWTPGQVWVEGIIYLGPAPAS